MSEWDYTKNVRRWSRSRGYADGTHHGYPIIARDSPVEGCIDIRSKPHGGEAVIVDSTDPFYGRFYDALWTDFKDLHKAQNRKKSPNRRATAAAYKAVSAAMAYDPMVVHVVDYRLKIEARIPKKPGEQNRGDMMVNLGHFLIWEGGICRHQAPATAFLLQRAYQEEMADGWASSDANYEHARGGHNWVRLTPEDPVEDILIADPAQNFVGTLTTAYLRNAWDYMRPGELASVSARIEQLSVAQRGLARIGLRF